RFNQRAAYGQIDERDGLAVLQPCRDRILEVNGCQTSVHAPVAAATGGVIGCRQSVEERCAWSWQRGDRCGPIAHGGRHCRGNRAATRAAVKSGGFLVV